MNHGNENDLTCCVLIQLTFRVKSRVRALIDFSNATHYENGKLNEFEKSVACC